jgi:hypothetical protein
MSFELKSVVPWGRSLAEYQKMFDLTESDLTRRIASFGDGPASFNAEMTKLNHQVVSFDPIYQFSAEELEQRISETKDTVIEQTRHNHQNFVWTNIKNIEELIQLRMTAMSNFLEDFEKGKAQKRYIYHQLPEPLPFPDSAFELGLSSHFLILYSQLGLDFHLQAISEMLRVCREIRIFPLLNLNAGSSEVLEPIFKYFSRHYVVKISKVEYEFQKNGNQMLSIKAS